MSALTPIEIEVEPSVMKMGYDSRLYVSSYLLRGTETPLLVIDTVTDTVTSIHYDNISFWDIALDSVNQKLYCAAMTKKISTDCEWPIYMESNMIYQIDLENQYSFHVFTPSEENIVLIESVPLDDPNYSCRIFATADTGKKIYYMDIE